ncbi:MAG: beta-glucosidase [Magnetospirillum sp. 64-120]|nr:MAG: beta-glucosidase [Magnetospirillum sp. 64-120]
MGTDAASKQQRDAFLDGLMAKMTLAEKLGQINLVTSNVPVGDDILADIRAGKVGGVLGGLDKISFGVNGPDGLRPAQEAAVNQSRLGIPLLLAFDVIHGHQSVFPIPLALSCTWDMERVRATARFAAREASASGLNWVFSPMVDIGRDPRWGRIAEGAGEDPFLGCDIAQAMVKGLQGDDLSAPDSVMACVKHFVGYGAPEAGRDYNNADMSPTRLHDVYLPPFKAAVEAGAASAMMSFSAVNGMPSHADEELLGAILGDVLKVSDFDGIPELIAHGLGDEAGRIDESDPLQTLSERSLRAGVQMDMMGKGFITRLEKALAEGRVSQAQIDGACRAVLEAKYKLGLFADPFARFDAERAKRDVLAPEYAVAARETAAESCVLLKNDGVLPLSKKLARIAVIGPLADDQKNITGPWAFQGDPAHAVSVLDGIRAAVGAGVKVRHARGANITENRRMVELLNFAGPKVDIDPRPPAEMMAQAVALAQDSDVVVAVLGEAAEMSGEAASRLDIGIPDNQRDLLKALVATGKPVVLVLMHGRPLTLPWENDHVPAILATWFGGHQAGHAIADLLFGDKVPSGKLTTSWPHHVGQVPIPYDRATTGRPGNPKEDPGKYTTRCYLDGSSEPLFPFGFGLSYTSFAYGAIVADKTELQGDEVLTVTVPVTNAGRVSGQEIVQLYLTDPVASRVRPAKQLRGYVKLPLQPGETKTARFTLTTADLEFHDGQLNRIWEPGRFVIGVGPNSRDLQSLQIHWSR